MCVLHGSRSLEGRPVLGVIFTVFWAAYRGGKGSEVVSEGMQVPWRGCGTPCTDECASVCAIVKYASLIKHQVLLVCCMNALAAAHICKANCLAFRAYIGYSIQ